MHVNNVDSILTLAAHTLLTELIEMLSYLARTFICQTASSNRIRAIFGCQKMHTRGPPSPACESDLISRYVCVLWHFTAVLLELAGKTSLQELLSTLSIKSLATSHVTEIAHRSNKIPSKAVVTVRYAHSKPRTNNV